jgi:hypothetical protein
MSILRDYLELASAYRMLVIITNSFAMSELENPGNYLPAYISDESQMLHLNLTSDFLRNIITGLCAWLVSKESRAKETITKLVPINVLVDDAEEATYCMVNQYATSKWCERLTYEYETFGNAFD